MEISNLLSNIDIIILFHSWMSKYVVKIINQQLLCIENPLLVEFLLILKVFYPQFRNLVISHLTSSLL